MKTLLLIMQNCNKQKGVYKIKFFCFSLLFFFITTEAFADNQYRRIILSVINSQKSTAQFFIQLESVVYESDFEENITKSEIIYKQNILWIREETLVVETLDLVDNLLHLILYHKDKKIEKAITKNSFSTLEVFPVFSEFYGKKENKLLRRYHNLGINYFNIKLEQKDLDFFYRLGDQNYILINKIDYKVNEFSRVLYYNNEIINYQTTFRNWDSDYPRIPRTINHSINGELFKEDKILKVRVKGLAKIRKQLLKKHAIYLQ